MGKLHPIETKREVIRLYFEEGLGGRRIAKKLDLCDPSLVFKWVHNYINYGEASFTPGFKRIAGLSKDTEILKKRCKDLEEKLIQQNHQIQYLKLMSGCYDENISVEEKCAIIRANTKGNDISMLCRQLGVARSSYYRLVKETTPCKKIDDDLFAKIKEIYDASHGTYGYRRIMKALEQEGIHVNHKKLQRILHDNDMMSCLYVPYKRSFPLRTAKPNLLKQQFYADTKNKAWCSDITSFFVNKTTIKLMCIMDLGTGNIIGYRYARNIPNAEAILCVKVAMQQCENTNGIIFHTDRGGQFVSDVFCTFLYENGFLQSMSRPGCCHDNARIESYFCHMKAEMPIIFPFSTVSGLYESIDKYIEYYNTIRIR